MKLESTLADWNTSLIVWYWLDIRNEEELDVKHEKRISSSIAFRRSLTIISIYSRSLTQHRKMSTILASLKVTSIITTSSNTMLKDYHVPLESSRYLYWNRDTNRLPFSSWWHIITRLPYEDCLSQYHFLTVMFWVVPTVMLNSEDQELEPKSASYLS